MALTAKMVKFSQEYCIDSNATQAAIRAGYSEDTAGAIGHENLKKPEISNYIKKLQSESLKALKITRDRVINELGKIAFADIRKAFDENSSLKSIKDIDANTAAALNSVEIDDIHDWVDGEKVSIGQTKKIKFNSKQAALDSLAKMGGWNAPEKIAQTDAEGNNVTPCISLTLPAGMQINLPSNTDES